MIQQPSQVPVIPARPSPEAPLGPTYTEDFFFSLLPAYQETAYPVNPIITSSEIAAAIGLMHKDPGKAAIVYAMAAVTLNLSYPRFQHQREMAARIQDLTVRSVAARRQATAYMERAEDVFGGGTRPHNRRQRQSSALDAIMTLIFHEISFMTFNKEDLAVLALREAIALTQLLVDDQSPWLRHDSRQEENNTGHHRDRSSNDGPFPSPERARLQRLYWEVFIHERYQTVVTMQPFVLSPPRFGLPESDATIPRHVHRGFTRLIRLFRVIDDDFLRYWREEDRSDGEDGARLLRPLTVAWVEQKQAQLDGDDLDNREGDDQAGDNKGGPGDCLTELQQADLIVTRAWIRTLVWQMAMARCLLASDRARVSDALSLAFPACRLSAQLRVVLSGRVATPGRSIAMHGAGILRKMFEVINTVADVMILVPDARRWEDDAETEAERRDRGRSSGKGGRMENFAYLVGLFMRLERVDVVLRGIIQTKVESLREIFPGFVVEGLDNSP